MLNRGLDKLELLRIVDAVANEKSIDKDIVIGDLKVPAGEYTLFSIPEEDGGTLIVNTQTGQNGRNYNPEYDFGRLALQKETLSTLVEDFTITVAESEQGARLNLAWGYTQYYWTIELWIHKKYKYSG